MKPDDELLKKKKKRPSRFARFIFIMILIIAIVSLIFYSVDNPGFIPSIKDKIIAFYTSDESTATDSSTTQSGQAGSEVGQVVGNVERRRRETVDGRLTRTNSQTAGHLYHWRMYRGQEDYRQEAGCPEEDC